MCTNHRKGLVFLCMSYMMYKICNLAQEPWLPIFERLHVLALHHRDKRIKKFTPSINIRGEGAIHRSCTECQGGEYLCDFTAYCTLIFSEILESFAVLSKENSGDWSSPLVWSVHHPGVCNSQFLQYSQVKIKPWLHWWDASTLRPSSDADLFMSRI